MLLFLVISCIVVMLSGVEFRGTITSNVGVSRISLVARYRCRNLDGMCRRVLQWSVHVQRSSCMTTPRFVSKGSLHGDLAAVSRHDVVECDTGMKEGLFPFEGHALLCLCPRAGRLAHDVENGLPELLVARAQVEAVKSRELIRSQMYERTVADEAHYTVHWLAWIEQDSDYCSTCPPKCMARAEHRKQCKES